MRGSGFKHQYSLLTVKHEECLILGRERREASETAARLMVEELERQLRSTGEKPVTIAWCGGTSPADIFPFFTKRFAALSAADRKRIHFALIDERRAPPSSPDSNYKMLNELLFEPLVDADLLDRANVHPFPVEKEPEEACKLYTATIEKDLGGINIAVLGIGPDGHLAALFPEHGSIRSKKSGYVFVPDRPKPPKEGFSASPSLLGAIPTGFLLFFGPEKEKPLIEYLSGGAIEEVPARIGKTMKRAYIVTDRKVAPQSTLPAA